MLSELSPQLFILFRSVIEERAGLRFELPSRETLESRIALHAAEKGMTSLLDYYYFLRYDPAGPEALDRLIEDLVVGETYFFRELEPLQVVVEEVIAPLVRAGGRPRVWSAACSTGEEPLTLAMLLASKGLLPSVNLVATDISWRALERAQRGQHGTRSLRRGDVPEFARDFLSIHEGRPVVRADLREAIEWARVNLVERGEVARLGTFDVVFCRNVLIYFSEETTQRVLRHLHDALRMGGVLLVGVSESLLRFGRAFELEERRAVSLYRKVT